MKLDNILKKGISLIVLIITIIIVIILAAAVILTLSKNNPIESAKEARFKEDVRIFQDELAMTVSKQYANAGGHRDEKISTTNFGDIKKFIPSFNEKYKDKFVIEDDNIYITLKASKDELIWRKSLNIKIVVPNEWKGKISSLTDDGVPVPFGFYYLEGDLNSGTVIKDAKGNEFVWIPVDGKNIIYQKDFPIYERSVDTALPTGIVNENDDVNKYGGYYIGRYEVGIPDGKIEAQDEEGIPVIKKDVTVWTNIKYSTALKNSRNMINNEYVQTDMMTGASWDTACRFIEQDVNITDSLSYGNYAKSVYPANVDGHGLIQKTGFCEYWKVKNIYDMAGNATEMASEIYWEPIRYERGGRI